MKKNHPAPLFGKLLRKIAPKIGATVVMEPEWGIVGQIAFKNGRKRYFRYSSLDLNPLGASDVAKDKDYAKFFMRRMGYPVPEGEAFFSDDWCRAIGSRRGIRAAYRYARKLGFPVIVKPNSGSQGAGVALVYNKKEFWSALRAIFRKDKVALVERQVRGTDYRVVVLDGKVISAYTRTPLCVTGDGRCTILELLKEKQRRFVAASRDTRLKLDDPRIAQKLRRQGLSMRVVPAKGARVFLLDNANLSTGGEATDVTRRMHPAFRRIAVRLTRDMGLRLCGVDLVVQGSIAEKPEQYWVLEVNAAPGLDHYAATGRAQEKIVERLYLKVLKSMSR
jgi:D-alanine-D-alanine ligase-like ATP-grasp enzyme